MAAHHFNFILANLAPGDHTIVVQAEIKSNNTSQTGSSSAWATIGKGSLTVEEIRAVNSPEGIVLD